MRQKHAAEKEEPFAERHVSEVFGVEEINGGIYRKGGTSYGLARLEGTNFSVMSEGEQNVREDTLIYIMSMLNYPVQFISSTVIADTTAQATEIALMAEGLPDEMESLKTYMFLYAGTLEQMKTERRVLTEQSWLVVSDDGEGNDPAKKIREKMYLLASNLKQRARIALIPLETAEETIDALHQMVLPGRIVRPSERAAAGVTEPVHFGAREIPRKGVA